MTKKLYPCILYFEEKIENEIRSLQNNLSKLTNAKYALSTWRPHITAGKTLYLEGKEFSEISKELKKFAKTQSQFDIELKDFKFWSSSRNHKRTDREPYGINIEVISNPSLISFVNSLNKILKKFNYFCEVFPYKPHITLANRDLNKEGFKKAKEFLRNKNFSRTTNISSFSFAIYNEEKKKFIELKNFNLQD